VCSQEVHEVTLLPEGGWGVEHPNTSGFPILDGGTYRQLPLPGFDRAFGTEGDTAGAGDARRGPTDPGDGQSFPFDGGEIEDDWADR
jgi:hypothetical protein